MSTRTFARTAAIGVVIIALTAVILAMVVAGTGGDRIRPGTIVVVGDPSGPGMQQVLHELQDRAAKGDELRTSLKFDAATIFIIALVFLWIGVGAAIVWRQPSHWAGWLFLIAGLPMPLNAISNAVVLSNLKGHISLPLTGVFAWLGEFAFYPMAFLPLLFLLYPDGHLPSPRWRWSAAGLFGGTSLMFLAFLLRPGPYNNLRDDGIVYANPFGIDGFTWAGAVIGIGTVVLIAAVISTAVAVVVRFRRSTGEERQQMRLIAFVASLAGVGVLTTITFGVLSSAFGLEMGGPWANTFTILWAASALTIFVGIPVAYLVAIFRYRLWELDVVIKKAAVALVLTLLMAGVGIAALVVLGQFAFWDSVSRGVSVIVGVVFGLLFVPLLRLARKIASRLTFGKRSTPYEVLTVFGERVGETYSTEDVLPRMAHLLANATGATAARVLLRVGAELREEAAWSEGTPPDVAAYVVPVRHQGEELGALSVTMPPSDPMNPAKEKLIDDLASQAGLVLRNVKLIEELRASRQRLVAAQDEERRKIERNIHDGAQQQLVSLAVKLRLAQGLVARDAPKAEAMLGDLQAETQSALEDLRDLARGIYPPLLADKGLADALAAQTRKSAVPAKVEADGIGRYGADVEATVYFCALEALQNVAKYAEAGAITLRLRADDGHLTFEVEDDGRGFDPASTGYGTGLQGMADRLDAIGGTLEVRSAPGAGTTLIGTVPV